MKWANQKWQNFVHTLYLHEDPRMGKTIELGSRLESHGAGEKSSVWNRCFRATCMEELPNIMNTSNANEQNAWKWLQQQISVLSSFKRKFFKEMSNTTKFTELDF